MLRSYISNNTIKVIVKPNSKKTEIIGYDSSKGAVKISLHAIPENNKANIELLKFLSKQLKTKVRIIKGLTSKEKLLKIENS